MATAQDIITTALRRIGEYSPGETLDPEDGADGLTSLNAMLDSWQIEKLAVYQIRSESFTWTAGAQTRTIGSGGNFSTDRPTQVDDSCAFQSGNIDYPVRLIDESAWAAIPAKQTTSSFPKWIYPEYGTTLVTLYAYPIPSASITFLLRTWKRLQSFSGLTTTLDLPPGYQRALEWGLADEMAEEYGRILSPRAQLKVAAAKKAIKRVNTVVPILATEAGMLTRSAGGENVYADIT